MLSLIGTTFPYNTFTYDATGHIGYDYTTNAFNLDATPLIFKPSSSISRPITGSPALHIRINVDNSGHLIGGVAGPDLTITGTVAGYGSGTLLTGEISQFEFLDSPTSTDQYAFRFTPTGGAVASYFSAQDICITTNSESSNFAGNFNVDFSGGAKGNVGIISPLLSSLAGNVYLDANNNGLFESGETGIGSTTVKLAGTNVDGLVVNQTTLTAANGAYNFASLRPGTYALTETQPAGYLDGIDTVGTPGGTAGNDVFSNIVLAAGVNGVNNNFGELPMLPGIQLVKLTNGGHDPNVPVGDPVTWTYEVNNTGNVALSGVSVSDDQGVTPLYQSGDTNLNDKLDTGELWIYSASGIATAGQYANVGTATATATDATGTVNVTISTTDVDHYFGVNPQLQLVKFTNTTHNPDLEAGTPVSWTYEVTNPGNVDLMNLSVTDDQGVTPVYQSGDTNVNGLLDPGEMWIYTASGTAIVGQYNNIGTATAYDATNTITQPMTVTGADGYFGVAPAIQIVKLTNGANNANANVAAGSTVTWTYDVT
ncbi:MAG: SdrD B-like domain-containing protein, partial [Thermoguttaceae bacterium]